MAKETVQAVSNAEENALQQLKDAQTEGEKLISGAAEKSKEIILKAAQEAHKKADVLLGSAEYELKSVKAKMHEDTVSEIEALRLKADAKKQEASSEILKLVLD